MAPRRTKRKYVRKVKQTFDSSVVWNVPAGIHSIESLVDEMASMVVKTGRRVAESRATEAEAWMKDNAPWKDGEGDRWSSGLGRNFPPGNARNHLHAYARHEGVEYSYDGVTYQGERGRALEDQPEFQALLQRVGAANTRKLSALNAERTAAGLPRYKRLPSNMLEKITKEKTPPFTQIVLSHGSYKQVPYAIWLELAHQGRYNIMARARHYWGQRLHQDMVNISRLPSLGVAKPPEFSSELNTEFWKTFDPKRTIRGGGSGNPRGRRRT